MKKILIMIAILVFVIGCAKEPVPSQPSIEEPVDTPEIGAGEVAVEVEQPTEEPTTVVAEEPVNKTEPETPVALESGTHYVKVNRFGFEPNDITVKAGDTVVWNNEDDRIHLIVGKSLTTESGRISQGWRSKNMQQGDTYNHTFTEIGEYTYVNGVFGITGKVFVE